MKDQAIQTKADRSNDTASGQAAAGPKGASATPPGYGIDFIDRPPQQNSTGLPDRLRAGVEQLSGLPMDDVRVHYNSDKPAQLQALAYTQGSEIHVAPGQERHLPHEAWHVVQQKQGRVKTTMQMKEGVPVNDDRGLEAEADLMGDKAVKFNGESRHERPAAIAASSKDVIQRFPVSEKVWGAAHNIRGGTSMTAKVGAMSEWSYGSKPPGKVPNLMTKVGVSIQGGTRYIAGHLLNDNMGGLGVNENLTVLSSDANKKHRGIEGKLKSLAEKADAINKGSTALGNIAYDHGARYGVEVLPPSPVGTPPFSPQEKYIGMGLKINIRPIRIHKITKKEEFWPEEHNGTNALTDHSVPNVPPYPKVPQKKRLTPVQKHIRDAIDHSGVGASEQYILNYINANVTKPPTKNGVRLGLRRGVKSKFFSVRSGIYKVIAKNVA